MAEITGSTAKEPMKSLAKGTGTACAALYAPANHRPSVATVIHVAVELLE